MLGTCSVPRPGGEPRRSQLPASDDVIPERKTWETAGLESYRNLSVLDHKRVLHETQ